MAGALISAFGDALIPIAFAIECHRLEPSGWGMSSVLIALWAGRFIGMYWSQKRTSGINSVRTMLMADLVRACAQLGLVAYILIVGGLYQGTLAVIALCLSSFVYGLAAAFFMPARFVSIAELSTESQRNTINSLLSMVGDTCAIVGPLVGGIAVVTLGFNWILCIDGITFLIAMMLLLPLARMTTLHVQDVDHEKHGDSLALENRTDAVVELQGECLKENIVDVDNNNSMTTPVDSQDASFNESSQAPLPKWVILGFISWAVVSLSIGVLGAAGPTEVLGRFGVEAWAGVAMALGLGSLVGSTATLTGITTRINWKILHIICCLLMACQVLGMAYAPSVWMIVVAGFAGSLAVSVSGIRWDNLGQSFADARMIHAFAHKDQVVNTAAIPLGMVLFGLAGRFEVGSLLLTSLALGCLMMLVIVSFIPASVEQGARTSSS